MGSVSVDLLVGNIVSILENEASLIGGTVKAELNELMTELKSMRSFMVSNRALTEGEKTWVENVRDSCSPVEDIIDEFLYHMNKQQSGGKFMNLLYQTLHFPKNLWVRHRVATKLQEINRKIKSIPERRQRYGTIVDHHVEGITNFDPPHDDQTWRVTKGDHLVGMEDDRRLLVGWLTDGESHCTVVSVTGMGGSGKTTLVAKVYGSQLVKRHFDCHAWITVSQNYVVEDVIKTMIMEFYSSRKEEVPADLGSMSYTELLKTLVQYLRQKRYVVVFDDVWSHNFWNDINVSLPDEERESRVMVTTRNETIASTFGVKSHVFHVKPLETSDAWNLFCTKAFSSNPNSSCPKELENTALGLVVKCGGLPLAILALGGVMSSKKLPSEWIEFKGNFNQELTNNPDLEVVKSVLWLSFSDLSFQLKRCFLYCCMFPEDYLIRRKRLIRLWMAEGFVEQVRAKTPECVAEDYLMELVHRSMLQVAMRNESGRPKACRMHDLIRDLALSTSETEKFCAVYGGQEASKVINTRLSIRKSFKDENSFKGTSRLRSLFAFVADKISPSSATILPSGLRLLKVLDLQNVAVDNLPEEVVDLFNLRYLNLRGTKVKELPKSIGRLSNLQTLNIRDSKIEVLPGTIVKLKKLRHLNMYRYTYCCSHFYLFYGTPALSSICKLKNLQILDCVEAEPNLLKQLRNMTQLVRIGISKVRNAYEDDLCISIGRMNLLRHLSVMATNEEEYLGMNALSSAPPCLEKLIFVGKLEKIPSWFDSLQCLTYLHLHWSKLSQDLLPHIQTLPNLGQLVLVNAYAGNKLYFSTGFNKLKRLLLRNLPQLNEIVIEKGVMPGLQRLVLVDCAELKILPRGIEYLTNLNELSLEFVTTELVESIRGEESVDLPRVRHIPEINHYYRSTFGTSYESLSQFDFKKDYMA